MSELLAVTTVGGEHAGTRAVTELSWPMTELLPADGGWYVRVEEYDWASQRLDSEIRGARYAWHPQPRLPPKLPWLSVSRVREEHLPPGDEVRNWLTGLFYAENGIMVRSTIHTVEYVAEINVATRLIVNGLNIIRGDFWDNGVLVVIAGAMEERA